MKNIFLKIHYLLSPSERRKTLYLLILMFIGMLLETLGIGLIIPVMTIMLQDNVVEKFPAIVSIVSFNNNNPSQESLIVSAMVGLVAIYLVKNTYLAFLIRNQTNFSFSVGVNLSQRFFSFYLNQPYAFHLQRNSAELIRNVGGEVGTFVGIITSSLMLITEFMVLIGIIILLLFVEPLGALTVAVMLGLTSWCFYQVTRKRISKWGKERQFHDGLRIKHLQQGLGGVKDVKLSGREKYFLSKYDEHNKESARVSKLATILQSYPRLMFEFLVIIGLAALVITMIGQGQALSSITLVLGLFAAAAFRLMPSINRILNSIQLIKFSLPGLDVLCEEMKQFSPVLDKKIVDDPAFFNHKISLINLKYQYATAASPALDDISIEIYKGEIIGIIGESGSGKSTLVDIVLGLLTPIAGVVKVDNNDIQNSLRNWQDQIGYVPQSIYLTDDTLRRNIAFGLPDEKINDLAVNRAVSASQLDKYILSLPDGLETIVGERGVRLSGGQRQRIGIARALYHDPDVLVLDEATSALDTNTEAGVMEAVRNLKTKTIIIVAHRLSTLVGCGKIYRLNQGAIVAFGSPQEMLKTSKVN